MNNKIFFLVAIAIILNNSLFSQGCSQCRLMAEQGLAMEETAFGSNINSGILYLMLIPYFLLLFLFRHQLIGLFKKLRKSNN